MQRSNQKKSSPRERKKHKNSRGWCVRRVSRLRMMDDGRWRLSRLLWRAADSSEGKHNPGTRAGCTLYPAFLKAIARAARTASCPSGGRATAVPVILCGSSSSRSRFKRSDVLPSVGRCCSSSRHPSIISAPLFRTHPIILADLQ